MHHLNPDDFLRRSFVDTNGDVAVISVPVLLGLLLIRVDGGWRDALVVSGSHSAAWEP